MIQLKPSKILLLSLGVATVVGSLLTESANAEMSVYPNRSVRDMMARRRKGEVKPAKLYQERVNIGQTTGVAPVYDEEGAVQTADTYSYTPQDKDGSLFPGGDCVNCYDSGPIFDTGPCERCYDSGPIFDTGPCEKCTQEPAKPMIANYAIKYNDFVVQALAHDCCSLAPIYLEHVDFNLRDDEWGMKNKMGNYRFRIFGCRRYTKEAVLNQGRVMEKDMHFNQMFEAVVGKCYHIVKKPEDLCLQKTPSPLPEYILTAEITDYFMNVCDGYNWKKAQKDNLRTGSSEITVNWKLSNLTKTKVLWEGQTTGYADLKLGHEDGELILVEAAFADAVRNLRSMPGFEDRLAIRLTPEELTAERNALIDEEIALNPAKCHFEEELHEVKQCQITRSEAEFEQCPAVVENAGVVSDYDILNGCMTEDGGVIEGGSCKIVDDTWVEVKEEIKSAEDVKSFDSLCIVDRPPYPDLRPENLYKLRASVVEMTNALGKKGAGLIISESFVLTSADLVSAAEQELKIKTINGKELTGKAVRVNPTKNIALVMLSEQTEYTPLSLNLDLPKVGQNGFMTLGMLDVEDFGDGENYIDNNGKILGYRYSEDKGSEIIVDTDIQNMTIGGVLIDEHGTINGVAHTGLKTDAGKDLFLPTEIALRSVGLSICEKLYEKPSPWQQTVYKPVTEKILTSAPKAPEVMKAKDRK